MDQSERVMVLVVNISVVTSISQSHSVRNRNGVNLLWNYLNCSSWPNVYLTDTATATATSTHLQMQWCASSSVSILQNWSIFLDFDQHFIADDIIAKKTTSHLIARQRNELSLPPHTQSLAVRCFSEFFCVSLWIFLYFTNFCVGQWKWGCLFVYLFNG